MLRDEESWSSLSTEQQKKLYALLPQVSNNGRDAEVDTATHPLLHPVYSEAIKDHIAGVERAIQDQTATLKWKKDASLASEQRRAGTYDETKQSEREDYWGQKGGKS